MIPVKILLQALILTSILNAQQFTIKGEIFDAGTNSILSFANIRIDGTTLGTSANVNGEYELKIKKGEYILIASFICYFSDTLKIVGNKNINDLNFSFWQ